MRYARIHVMLLRGDGQALVPEVKSLGDVRREIRSRSGNIFENQELLHKIRWLKYSRQQRISLLLRAWPNVTSSHHPNFEVFWQKTGTLREYDGAQRERFLCPYINKEDLLVPKALLLLLNSRGRHPPSLFAAQDINAMRVGIKTKRFSDLQVKLSNGKLAVLDHYFVKVNGFTENTPGYGKLVSKKYQPEAFDGYTNKKECDIKDGLFLLEDQEKLLTFLVHACQKILHDFPQATMTDDYFPIFPEPELKSEVSGYESLALKALEAPYHVPAQLDLSVVQSHLAARVSALEDHLWVLREDPGYFVTQFLQAKEHQMENLKDPGGKTHPLLAGAHKHAFAARVLSNFVSEAYLHLGVFNEARKHGKRELPLEYLQALLRFYFFLDLVPDLLQSTLWHAAPASPPLRRLFYREPSRGLLEDIHVWANLRQQNEDEVQHQLLGLYLFLSKANEVQSLFTMPVLLDELERLTQLEPSAREMLTLLVSADFGDLSVLAQCLRQLDLYQPWSWTWRSTLAKRRDEFVKEYSKRSDTYCNYHDAISSEKLSKAAILCDFSNGKFTYPFDKPRTKENFTALRNAEHRLDTVWTAIDRAMLKAGSLRGTAAGQLVRQKRILRRTILRRTREWVDKENNPSDMSTVTDSYSLYLPMSTVYKGLGNPTTQTLGSITASNKYSASSEVARPTFSVNARALKVFRNLFFNPSITSTPGEIAWNDFLYTMTSVEFTILKMYNSTWQFTPTKLGVERSIQFNEPKGKITVSMARVFGRRESVC
ncbi:hypothetical protein BJX64DRAFT_300345 [Aspergillus heterothallicus]